LNVKAVFFELKDGPRLSATMLHVGGDRYLVDMARDKSLPQKQWNPLLERFPKVRDLTGEEVKVELTDGQKLIGYCKSMTYTGEGTRLLLTLVLTEEGRIVDGKKHKSRG
jgi:hypothetical protein